MFPDSKLIDARNWAAIKAALLSEIQAADKVGFDIETEDSGRHEGLNRFMKVKDGKKAGNKPLVFDIKRTTIAGFSWYCRGANVAYYLNLNHADVENRVPWEEARSIVEAIVSRPLSIAHNAPFERTMMKECYEVDLGSNLICSMQLAVTAFNDDTYDFEDFRERDLAGITVLVPAIKRAFKDYIPGKKLDSIQEELLFKVIAKESDAAHSYNGWVKGIAYRYGLKGLVKKFLGYEQKTFAEVLDGKAHMGELTGEEVVSYGADDAWTCVWLTEKLLDYISRSSPKVIPTYLTQENPMTQVYSDVWSGGLRIDIEAVKHARKMEREKAAKILRVMKKGVKALLPFPEEPHPKLKKYDKWFYSEKEVEGEVVIKESYQRYRGLIEDWANSPDNEDSFEQLYQVRSAISNVWAEDKGMKTSKGVNLNHYMPVRTILYDLCRFSYIQSEGKTQSNGEAQKTMRERWIKKHGEIKGDAALLVLDCMKHLSASEQNMKLYVTNYLNLTDPDTSKMYPTLNSLLNTRRLALSFPNVSQLPKQGYIRSVFLGDEEDHLVISADFSSQELLLIGEASGDLRFKEAFGQLPYEDLHAMSAAAVLDMSLESFLKLEDRKKKRATFGKVASFSYWFSGALGSLAKDLNWTSDEMWEKVDNYRKMFPIAERWRMSTIMRGKNTGEVELPDHHKRYRFEATQQWANIMRGKFISAGIGSFGDWVIKKVQSRAGNQMVNARIQGTAATMAKRTILSLNRMIKEKLYKARLMFPVHDELVTSCQQDQAFEFIKDFRVVMCNHPDLIKTLVVDATVAIGRNFGAYHPVTNKWGQIEIDEYVGPDNLGIKKGSKLNDIEIQKVIDYLSGKPK